MTMHWIKNDFDSCNPYDVLNDNHIGMFLLIVHEKLGITLCSYTKSYQDSVCEIIEYDTGRFVAYNRIEYWMLIKGPKDLDSYYAQNHFSGYLDDSNKIRKDALEEEEKHDK